MSRDLSNRLSISRTGLDVKSSRGVLDRFLAKNVQAGTERSTVREVFSKSTFVGLVFAAGSCPSSRNFLPFLEKFRRAMTPQNKFNVIFGSYDKCLTEMQALTKLYPLWYSLPWKDPLVPELGDLFEIDGVPTLIVLRHDLSLVTTQGRDDIMLMKTRAWQKWTDRQTPDEQNAPSPADTPGGNSSLSVSRPPFEPSRQR